jgi:hypothetical protein
VSGRTTRRGALGAALTGAAALALGGTARADDDEAAATAAALQKLIAREQAASFAYWRAGPRLLARLGTQDAQHALALRAHLESVARPAPAQPRTAADLDPGAARVAAARGGQARRRAAIALERELIDVYAGSLAALYDPNTVRTAATIMASHGQHLTVLSRDPLQAPIP